MNGLGGPVRGRGVAHGGQGVVHGCRGCPMEGKGWSIGWQEYPIGHWQCLRKVWGVALGPCEVGREWSGVTHEGSWVPHGGQGCPMGGHGGPYILYRGNDKSCDKFTLNKKNGRCS